MSNLEINPSIPGFFIQYEGNENIQKQIFSKMREEGSKVIIVCDRCNLGPCQNGKNRCEGLDEDLDSLG